MKINNPVITVEQVVDKYYEIANKFDDSNILFYKFYDQFNGGNSCFIRGFIEKSKNDLGKIHKMYVWFKNYK